MAMVTLSRHQWTIDDYHRIVAVGLFEKIELLCGGVMLTGGVVRPYHWTLEDYEQLIRWQNVCDRILSYCRESMR